MTKDRAPHRTSPAQMQLPLDFIAFHQMRRPQYIRYARTLLSGAHDAEDAVDAAFEKLFVKWDDVLRSDKPEAYAWKLMANQVKDHARAAGRRPASLEEAAFFTQALLATCDPIGQIAESMWLLRAVEQLSERQRDVFVMHVMNDEPEEKVAEALGMARASVRSHLRHARRRLAELLELNESEDTHNDNADR